MTRTLLVANRFPPPARGGRAMLSALFRESLQAIQADLLVEEIERAPVVRPSARLRALRGEIDGIDAASVRRVPRRVLEEDIRRVVLDGSNLGALATYLRRAAPRVEIVTHFHNVEARFFAGAFWHHPTPHALGVLVANYVAERQAARASHRLLCLTQRDAHLVDQLYGRRDARVLPMAVRDLAAGGPSGLAPPLGRPYVLFVGGGFYANRAGIRWFVEAVAPRLDLDVAVVGEGIAEGVRVPADARGRVHLVGAVDDLRPWYEHASLVVAPIFDGSGMKTKVAEALMFGKRVVATPDAFAGYEEDAARVGRVCADAEGFVEAIKLELAAMPDGEDPACRAAYEARYSPRAHASSLARALDIPFDGGAER